MIPIEETAYEILQQYVESLRRYFANEEGREEIIGDIENRFSTFRGYPEEGRRLHHGRGCQHCHYRQYGPAGRICR